MSIDSAADWDGLRAVSTVARDTSALLANHVRPGITTGELDVLAAQFLEGAGREVRAGAGLRLPGNRSHQHQR